MKIIQSPDNPTFRELKKLSSQSRERRKTGYVVLDGAHLVDACLKAGQRPDLLVVSESRATQPEITGLLSQMENVPICQLPDRLFAELSTVDSPSGLLARYRPETPANARASSTCLLLEDIQDPGNLGSMLRTAAAAGVREVFLSAGCADAWSPKVLRAGMGAHFLLAIHERADLLAIAEAFPGEVVATRLDADASLYETVLSSPVAFAFGNEGAGLSDALAGAATCAVSIPMPGAVESLNVAAATAICLFEWVRQTTYAD